MHQNTESRKANQSNERYGRRTPMDQEASNVLNHARHSNVPTCTPSVTSAARAGYTMHPYVPLWTEPRSPPLSWSSVQPAYESLSFCDFLEPISSSYTTDHVSFVPGGVGVPVSTTLVSVAATSVSESPSAFSPAASNSRRRRNLATNLPTSSVSAPVTTSTGSVTTSTSSSPAVTSLFSALPRNFANLTTSAPVTSTRTSTSAASAPIPTSVRSSSRFPPPSSRFPLPSWIKTAYEPLQRHPVMPANPFSESKQSTDILPAVQEIVDGAMEKFARGIERKMQEMQEKLLTEILSIDASKNSADSCEKKETKNIPVTNQVFEEAMRSLKTRMKKVATISKEKLEIEIPEPMPSTSTGNNTRPTPSNIVNDPDSESDDDQSNSDGDIRTLRIDLGMRSERIRELEQTVVRIAVACRETASNLRRDIASEFEDRLSELERKVDAWNDEYSYYEDGTDSQDYYF